MLTPLLLAAGVGYLLGAIPFGYLVARARGVDIFKVGSGNPGATNVLRTLGKGPGYTTFALDAVKGALAVAWIPLSETAGCPLYAAAGDSVAVHAQVLGLFCALLGHSFSCFTRFKGGKGVATAAGAFFVLLPLSTAAALVAWLLTFFTTRYVSLASIVAAAVLPAVAWVRGGPLDFRLMATVVGLLVIARHHSNISRLLAGTENRFVRKPKSDKVP